MSPNLDDSVQPSGMEVATFKEPLNVKCGRKKRLDGNSSGRKRIFVQTETGCVLGLELHRSDNAHRVKRKLQLALNVPTEESLLVYGDMILKHDLSILRNDSPLLLTRSFLHKSSSTPCLSPTGRDHQHRDLSGPIEILGCSNQSPKMDQLVADIVEAIQNGIDPVPVGSGLGGAYYFRNFHGENVAIVKPTDEEPYAPNNPKGFVGRALGQPGLKRSVRVGETAFREVAAFLLDYDSFASVPCTALVKVSHSVLHVSDRVNGAIHQYENEVNKIASLQQFIPHDFDASDHGTSSFPVASVHRIGILDIRILNTDRHAGNLLVKKFDGVDGFGEVELIPIDHGLCLPESLEDPYFEWIHWPQSSIPFSEDEIQYINNLDPYKDMEMLMIELPMIREACLRVLILCTTFLKEAAAFGLCLAEIGEMMSREFRGHEEEPSELELICIEAKKMLDEKELSPFEVNVGDKGIQFDIDWKEEMRNHPLSKLGESVGGGEEVEENLDEEFSDLVQNQDPNISKLCMSIRDISIGEKSWRHLGSMQKTGYLAGTSSGNRSVNEHLPPSNSFVKLAQMNELEWGQFLQNFQKLLRPAFANRKAVYMGQRQRLGTSCQF